MAPARSPLAPAASRRRLALPLLAGLGLAVAVVAAGCGPSASAKKAQTLIDRGDYAGAADYAASELAKHPGDRDLWRVRIRAALGQHDARGAVALYGQWRGVHGEDDGGTLRMMAMTTIWQALESPSATTRLDAVRAVERLELEPLADKVAALMGDDEDVVAAAAAVAILRSYYQAPHVAGELLGSQDPEARAIAVEGIGRKVGARAGDDLRPLATDHDPRVRRAVAVALGAIAEPRDTELLLELTGDVDGEVRAAALRALGRGKRTGELAAAARRALADDHLGVRVAAVGLLGALKDDAALQGLLGGDDVLVALHAARELGSRAGDAGGRALDRALGDAEWTVRAGAVNLAVAVVGKAAARARLEAALLDDRLDVRLAAARLLDGDVRAVTVMASALDGDDAFLKVQAAIDLARADDARGVAALDALVGDGEPTVRRAAAAGYLAAHRPGAGLATALGDDSPPVRLAAAEGILKLYPRD